MTDGTTNEGSARHASEDAPSDAPDDEGEDLRDVTDNPEWGRADVEAGRSLADFAPDLARAVDREVGRRRGDGVAG